VDISKKGKGVIKMTVEDAVREVLQLIEKEQVGDVDDLAKIIRSVYYEGWWVASQASPKKEERR